jgi:hypothetical protein
MAGTKEILQKETPKPVNNPSSNAAQLSNQSKEQYSSKGNVASFSEKHVESNSSYKSQHGHG